MSVVLALLFALGSAISAEPAESTAEPAVELLSRFPLGQVPVEPSTMVAIEQIGEHGGRAEVGVLRSLAEHERTEVRLAAIRAIEQVRGRQRATQRASHAERLESVDLQLLGLAWRRVGLDDSSASAAAYAALVLGDQVTEGPGPRAGDARHLLASGQPRRALAALSQEVMTERDLQLMATAREDAGDVRGALQARTLLALSGDLESEGVLAAHGVQPERLYLGLLVMERSGPVGDQEARLLEALVRRGDSDAAEVLSERMFSAGGSERASAADALIRMLDRADLSESARARVREALVRAVKEGPQPVRDIAASGL